MTPSKRLCRISRGNSTVYYNTQASDFSHKCPLLETFGYFDKIVGLIVSSCFVVVGYIINHIFPYKKEPAWSRGQLLYTFILIYELQFIIHGPHDGKVEELHPFEALLFPSCLSEYPLIRITRMPKTFFCWIVLIIKIILNCLLQSK